VNEAEIVNRHWSDAFTLFVEDAGGENRRYGTIDAFLGGIPMPFANGCLVLGDSAPQDLEAALAWIEPAAVPFLVRLVDAHLPTHQHVIEGHGLERLPDPMPGMLLAPIPAAPRPTAGVTVVQVDDASYDEFLATLVATGLPQEFAASVFPRRLIQMPHNAYFLGYLDGQPVGTSVAIKTGQSGGIYSVGTVEEARKRGVGRAVTWAAVDAIRAWGCSAAVLQSSVMGHSLYLAMGFRDAVQYVRFAPKANPATAAARPADT
jgi:GNAT superfamily N-acetyltransferase